MEHQAIPAEGSDYPFEGLDVIAQRLRNLRIEIVRESDNLDIGFIEKKLLKMEEGQFVRELFRLCQSRRQVQSELIQSLLELRGGLSPYAAEQLLANLVNLTGDTYMTERGNPLILSAPNDQLARKDPLLYKRSQQLCECVGQGTAAVLAFQKQFVNLISKSNKS